MITRLDLITARLRETNDVGRTMLACSQAGIGLDILLAAYLLAGVAEPRLEERLQGRFFMPDFADREDAVRAIRDEGPCALTGTLLDVIGLYYRDTVPRFHDRMNEVEDEAKLLALDFSDHVRVAPLMSIMNFIQRGEPSYA